VISANIFTGKADMRKQKEASPEVIGRAFAGSARQPAVLLRLGATLID
jgi:hypothetical protein